MKKEIKEKVDLENEIEALTKDSARLSQNILRLVDKISTDSVTLNKLKGEMFELKSVTSKEAMTKLKAEIKRLEEKNQRLDKSLADVRAEKDSVQKKDNKTKAKAEFEAQHDEEQRERSRLALHKEIKDYVDLKYSEMCLDSLKVLKKSLSQYPHKELEERLTEVISDKEKWFDPGMEYITNGGAYRDTGEGYDSVVSIRKQLIGWLKENKQSTKFQEVDLLDIKLSRMNVGIKFLQEIVANVNADEKIQECRKSNGTASAHEYTSQIDALTTKEKGNEDFKKKYERYIEMIPYLQNLLDAYRKELMKPQIALPTPTEKIITNLKVKE